ncbi:MAG TPA: ABC-2 family transporter protein [Chloroflexia bacterium]|nr:ABC-2 family transporter protein [Chloroflexia bacterium]
MRRYLKLYLSFIRICLMREMEARGSFVVGCLVIFCFPVFPLLLVGAIYSQVPNLAGWTLYQYLMLVGTFQIVSALTYTMFLRNIFQFPEYVRKGELDFFLLKPVNSQFMLTTRYLSFSELAQAVPGTALVIIGALNAGTAIDWWRWPLYAGFVACSVIICYAMWFIMTIPCIWFIRLDTQEFFFSMAELGRYHPTMFGGLVRSVLLYVIPFGIIAATPADWLLSRITWQSAGWMLLVTAGLLFLSNRFWRFAQTRYYGASS